MKHNETSNQQHLQSPVPNMACPGHIRAPWMASAFDGLDDFLKPFPSGDLSMSRSLSSNQVSNGAAEGQN